MGPSRAGRNTSCCCVVLAIVLSGLAVGYVAGQTEIPSGANAALERLAGLTQQCVDRGDFRQAAANYRRILQLRPDFPEARANLGLMHHLMGEYEEAIQHFEAALVMSPNLFVPNLFLGLDLLRLNRPDRAIPYLERAHQLNPRDEQATLALGQANASIRRFERANGWYERTVRLNPQNLDAWYGLGVTYLAIQREAMGKLIRVNDKSSYALALLAESYEEQGKLGEAISLYRQALASSSTMLCLHSSLGFAYLKHGDGSLARDEFESELKVGSNCLLARAGLARLSAERGEFAAGTSELRIGWKADCNFIARNATLLWSGLSDVKLDRWEAFLNEWANTAGEGSGEKALTRTLENALAKWRANPDDGEASADSPNGCPPVASNDEVVDAKSLCAQGRYEQCARALKASAGQLPAGDLLLLAQCSSYSGDYGTAFLASQRVLERWPGDVVGLYWRVKSAKELGVSSLMRAGLAQPDSPGVHLLLAEAHRAQSDSEEAEAEYREVLRRKPDDVAAHIGLATEYWQALDLDRAIQEVQSVFRLNPQDPEASYLMGRILVTQQHYTEAIPFLKNALSETSVNAPHAYALLGKIHAAEGKNLEAVAELGQALVADRDGSYHYQIYRLYKKLGDEKNAAAALEKFRALRARPH